MEISACNALRGRSKRITQGALHTEGVSIMAKESAERLSLSEGKEVYAVIKASDVMVAAD